MIEERLRGLLPRDARRRLGRLSRLRWVRKARIARTYGASLRRDPLTVLGFVLLDPEVDTFTYDLANEHELVNVTARALGIAPQRVAERFDEARKDPVLGPGLARRVRWRFDFKRRVRFGRRYAWYAIARELKPAVVVETGIKDGLGSVLLLRALQRNAAEGSPGRLISFDLYPDKGWLGAEALRDRWSPIFASTRDALAPALDGLEVRGCSCMTATPTPPPTSTGRRLTTRRRGWPWWRAPRTTPTPCAPCARSTACPTRTSMTARGGTSPARRRRSPCSSGTRPG